MASQGQIIRGWEKKKKEGRVKERGKRKRVWNTSIERKEGTVGRKEKESMGRR